MPDYTKAIPEVQRRPAITADVANCREPKDLRPPEIGHLLERQKRQLDELWENLTQLESKIAPILGLEPPEGTETGAKGRIEAATQIGAIIDEHNRSIGQAVTKVLKLITRVEV